MNTLCIFITRDIPQAGIDILKKNYTVKINPHDRSLSKQEIIDATIDADALLCMLTDTIDAEVISSGKRLKVISNLAVGFDNIDIDAARKNGIAVTNTPGVLTGTTAETAFALMITCARRIAEADRWIRTHQFEGWAPTLFLGQDLHKKTLGIAGLGRIGKTVARRAALGFEMRIIYTDLTPDYDFEKEYNAISVSKEELLEQSDFISLHLPSLPSTKHYIGEKELTMMKSTSCLINTARGPIVDEEALIDALRKRKIFAAGLDVFEHEPHISKALLELENVVLLPHIGSASIETRTRMSIMAAENIVAVLEGREPHSGVA